MRFFVKERQTNNRSLRYSKNVTCHLIEYIDKIFEDELLCYTKQFGCLGRLQKAPKVLFGNIVNSFVEGNAINTM